MIVQKLKSLVGNEYEKAEKYYSILSLINNLRLTSREIQLLAFTAIKGNISNPIIRGNFCSKFNTTFPTINNIVSKLKKMGILIKEGGEIKVNKKILLDFKKEIQLEIKLTDDEKVS